ncbi:POFUT2 [Cordylochernes scorpioides]|uniref:GDP-fucose protein O-fucosyltransferase 2 n=1 Tax=Cordylochernes scorpioides TaxID=51811 RepID=A0ABY6L3W0_9ARAC|nr:POFUT2 [Cordylochernes scorpioides]
MKKEVSYVGIRSQAVVVDSFHRPVQYCVHHTRYLLYDVNPPEGFNLRRDVYMRVAQLVKKLRKDDPGHNWTLVLPPWGPLYHWGPEASDQLPWSHFFHLDSLRRYVPLLELDDFLNEHGPHLDGIYYLQYPSDMADNMLDTFHPDNCTEHMPYFELADRRFYGHFWGYTDMSASSLTCLSVLGSSTSMASFLQTLPEQATLLDRAETLLHPSYGDAEFWAVRRSMRLSPAIVAVGDDFRREHLNSTDVGDETLMEDDWVTARSFHPALGGPYLAVHLRRQDFVSSRAAQVPSLAAAATQIDALLSKLGLNLVFIATDAPEEEFQELQSMVKEGTVLRFEPRAGDDWLGPGGVAAVDQWICAHGRYFLGTYESTFSFRIMEEREILGFPADFTFNRLCGDLESCEQPTRWRIQYPS